MSSSGSSMTADATNGEIMRGGLVFLKTRNRQEMVDFYQSRIGMKVWLEQPNITILKFGNLIIGWHQIEDNQDGQPDLTGMYTFVVPSKDEVDQLYEMFRSTTADGPPRVNERYKIYQFFAKDPEGRNLEFQAFLHPVTVVTSQVSEI
jgi:catechol-2,3-dioxygenase